MFKDIILNRQQHHKNLIVQIKKYDKAINIGLGSIAVIVISIILSYFIPQSEKAKENLKENQILTKMGEMDDIAHQQDVMLHDLSGYNMERDKLFHSADNKYHAAQYKDEKIKTVEILYEMIKKQNEFLYKIISTNPFSQKAKEKFDKIETEIDQLLTRDISGQDEKMMRQLDIFMKIDDIAHQEINEDPKENPFDDEAKEKFWNIDAEYHSTQDIQQKHIATQKMIDLIEEAEKNRPDIDEDEDSDSERDKIYRELLKKFNEIQ